MEQFYEVVEEMCTLGRRAGKSENKSRTELQRLDELLDLTLGNLELWRDITPENVPASLEGVPRAEDVWSGKS